jgi:hypothetical protein
VKLGGVALIGGLFVALSTVGVVLGWLSATRLDGARTVFEAEVLVEETGIRAERGCDGTPVTEDIDVSPFTRTPVVLSSVLLDEASARFVEPVPGRPPGWKRSDRFQQRTVEVRLRREGSWCVRAIEVLTVPVDYEIG